MENYIIGLFTEQLATYIHGFRKEQVNASLLSGKGEISEIHINVEPINDVLKAFIPYIELASVYVSKVSFNVSSIRNIRKAPIEISVDEVHVVLMERMQLADGFFDHSWADSVKYYVEQAKNAGSYGLIERIRDNIAIDVNRVYVTFQPMGKFKTRKIGPWTPPAISLVLNHVHVATVDEYGEEGTPDDVWRHNSRQGRQENSIRYRNSDNSKSERTYRYKTNMIFKKVSFELSIGIGYRLKGMSAKQTFLNSEVIVLTNVPIQCHLAMHRRLRDNALLAVQADMAMTNIEVVIKSETLPLLVHAMNGVQYCLVKDRTFVDPLDDGEVDESILLLNDALPSYKIENDELESIKTSNDEGAGDNIEGENNNATAEQFELDSDEEESNVIESSDIQRQQSDESNNNTGSDNEQWPAFVLPSGIVIFEKLCVSVSIHSMSIRAVYNSECNGYIQCTMKGLISELIFPESMESRKGFVQLSLSHINIHETYSNRVHTLINGGNYIDRHVYGNKVSSKDVSFPSMEPRDVRNDPFDMDTSFPTQAFSLKASIDILGKDVTFSLDGPMFVLLEVGMNAIEVTYYPAIFDRSIDFFWKHAAQKFEGRWFTGEWRDELPSGIEIDISKCLQPLPEVMTREFKPSTENFNITAKMSDFRFRIPAPMAVDVIKCSDIVMKIADFIIVASSALPCEFLSSDIFSTGEKDKMALPDTSSSVRFQLTMNGFEGEVTPSPLYTKTKDPQKVLYFRAFTFLGSYDRVEKDVNLERYYLFASLRLHHAQVNIDFDVLHGAVSTINNLLLTSTNAQAADNKDQPQARNPSLLSKLPEELQIQLRLNLSKVDCRVWRQNVPMATSYIAVVPYMPLMHLDIENLELGARGKLRLSSPMSESDLNIFALQIGKLQLSAFELIERTSFQNNGGGVLGSPEFKDVVIISMGKGRGKESEGDDVVALSFYTKSTGDSTNIRNIAIKVESSTFQLGNEVENMLFLVMEAALDPEWLSLFQRVNQSDAELDTSTAKTEVEKTESSLGFVSTISILSQIELLDIALVIPLLNEEKAICAVCEKTNLSVGMLRNCQDASKKWLEIFHDDSLGLHADITSRQKVVLLSNEEIQRKDYFDSSQIVQSFEVKSNIHPLHGQGKVENINLSTKDIIALDKLSETLLGYKNRINALMVKTSKLNFPINKGRNTSGSRTISVSDDPISVACESSKESIKKTRLLVDKMNASLSVLKERIASSFASTEHEVNKTRAELFKKESERFAAFSLLTNDASGYLQVASPAIGNQRLVSITNFWRYWVVLKQNTIILYNNPTDAIPIDHFSLDGAKLVSLIKGNTTRRNLMKGFAIVDSNGRKRFFIAETYAKFEQWMYTLQTILIPDEIGKDAKDDNDETQSLGNQVELPVPFESNNAIVNYETISVEGNEAKRSNLRDKARSRMSKFGSAMKNNVRMEKNPLKQLNGSQFPKIGRRGSNNEPNPAFENEKQEQAAGNEEQTIQQDEKIVNTNDLFAEDQASDTISVPDAQSTISEDAASSFDNAVEDSGGKKMLKFKEKAKHSMSKIGTAVKNTSKIPKISLKMPPTSTGRLSDTHSMKIRGLDHGEEEPELKEQIMHEDQKMCALLGTWTANVAPVLVNDTTDSSSLESSLVRIELKCHQWPTYEGIKPSDIEVIKPLSEILKFHAEMSSALMSIASNLETAGLMLKAQGQNTHIFAQILHSGRLLKGLLQSYDEISGAANIMHIVCQTLEQFVCSLLSYPLPSYPFIQLKNFMCLQKIEATDLGTVVDNSYEQGSEQGATDSRFSFDCEEEFLNIAALVESCKVALSQAERQSNLADRLSRDILQRNKGLPVQQNVSSHLRSSKIQNVGALHDALMTVMAERDVAQSQLLAERVFHTHELDQERRKVEVLEKKIEVVKRLNNEDSASAAAFFLGTEDVPNKHSLGKIEKDMVQNVDAELMELCRQLSSEIATRVSTELEILRLKESRRIEVETEKRQLDELQEELNMYKQKVANAQNERDQYKVEAEKWKQCFDTAIKHNNDEEGEGDGNDDGDVILKTPSM